VGIDIKARTIEPEKAVRPVDKLKVFFINGTKIIIPIKPIITLGIAAISSMRNFKKSLRFSGAISDIKSADIMLIGIAIIHAPKVIRIEPIISGKIPKDGGFEAGNQCFPVINLNIPKFFRKVKLSTNKNPNINITNITDNIPHMKIAISMILLKDFFIFFYVCLIGINPILRIIFCPSFDKI
jgi:hypothetical protein